MEVFQKLKIVLPEKKKHSFFQRLEHEINHSSWKIRDDLITNYKKNTFSNDKDILCAESPKLSFDQKAIKGLLWLWDYNGYYEVFNIIPIESRSLSFKEYNYILNAFYSDIVEKLANDFNAIATLSKPEKFISETIGKDAYKALQSFSSGANKTTGNIHPYDFERWCEFVFIIFKKEIDIDSAELEAWFLENGWSHDMATKLTLDFEYSIDLLKKYEQNQ